MKFNGINEELQRELAQKLENAEDKSTAIVEVVERLNAEAHKDLVEQLQAENEELKANEEVAQRLGIRTSFSKDERAFYEKLCAKQAVTADTLGVIPCGIVDRTLADIKEASDTLKLVEFAPANVQHWLTGAATGAAAWGALNAALTDTITAAVTSLPIQINKLYCIAIVPKAIRDLEIGVVDKYFRAVLSEAMHDGIVDGYLNGDGKTAPVGIFKQLAQTNGDGTAKAKTKNTMTGFRPTEIKNALIALSNNGKRKVSKLYVVANPVDCYSYVYPALRYFTGLGYASTCDMDVEVIEEPMCTSGQAALTIEGRYTMGFSGVKVDEYKEAKAIDDADLIVAKVYGNGRADDDNVAYIIDTTKLAPYVPSFNAVTGA